jgi:hypothetical protein
MDLNIWSQFHFHCLANKNKRDFGIKLVSLPKEEAGKSHTLWALALDEDE